MLKLVTLGIKILKVKAFTVVGCAEPYKNNVVGGLVTLVLLFGLMLNVLVNSYGHVGTVRSPNHAFFFWASLTKW